MPFPVFQLSSIVSAYLVHSPVFIIANVIFIKQMQAPIYASVIYSKYFLYYGKRSPASQH